MKVLPQEKIGPYLMEADKRGLLAAYYLELTTGLRRGELLALLWTDLDVEARTISVTKQVNRIKGELVLKQWFRHFNDHKEFHNEGNLHLFSLMALFSYANFRSNERVINGVRYMEAPGQWVCKLGSLPRILRVHSKAQALDLMKYFEEKGFLQFEVIDEDQEIIRYTINDWKRHCTHLAYNYYSYKGSGFFLFPLPIGRLLLRAAKTEGRIVFSELDALMDMWLHTIVNDPSVKGSEYMPVVYYPDIQNTLVA